MSTPSQQSKYALRTEPRYQVFAPQRSLEWHKSREGRIGASTAAVALGISPHNSPFEYWSAFFEPGIDPRFRDFPSNVATRHGTRYEALACMVYEMLTGNVVRQTGMWLNEQTFLYEHSTPDGLVEERPCSDHAHRQWFPDADGSGTRCPVDGGLEIKCPLYKLYEHVPAYYLAQVQQQMRTKRLPWGDFFVYFRKEQTCALWRIYYCEAWTAWAEAKFETFAACRSRDEVKQRVPWLQRSMQELVDTDWNWDAAARKEGKPVSYLKKHLPNVPVRIEHRFNCSLRERTIVRGD